jgi:probable HAF family extracellular repeat protein
MKNISSFKIPSVVLIIGLSTGLGFANPSSAQQLSYLIDLNSKQVTRIGSTNTNATAINDAGQVVGDFDVAKTYSHHAFITGVNGVGMTDLGTLGGADSYATGVNAVGQGQDIRSQAQAL